MNKKLSELWDKAERTGEEVNIGDIVVCDICDDDYTDSEEKGGFLFESKAVCPRCSPQMEQDIKKYKEEQYIRGRAGPEETFKQFVMRIRDGRNIIKVGAL